MGLIHIHMLLNRNVDIAFLQINLDKTRRPRNVQDSLVLQDDILVRYFLNFNSANSFTIL